MYSVKLKKNVWFTTDNKRLVVVNKENGSAFIIGYPEAAVWSVLIENPAATKSVKMLGAILKKREDETEEFIRICMEKWRLAHLIE